MTTTRRKIPAHDRRTPEVTLRTRGRLPHLECERGTYFVTFRLANTLPWTVIEEQRNARAKVARTPCDLYDDPIESYLDTGLGDCWLADARVAALVVGALKFFDKERYLLHSWCVMPNHVHVVFTMPGSDGVPRAAIRDGAKIAPVIQSWKSFTAKEANRFLGRGGEFWQREYYDHLVRGEKDLLRAVQYTIENPVKAYLCSSWEEWPWTGLGDLPL